MLPSLPLSPLARPHKTLQWFLTQAVSFLGSVAKKNQTLHPFLILLPPKHTLKYLVLHKPARHEPVTLPCPLLVTRPSSATSSSPTLMPLPLKATSHLKLSGSDR
ncbi:hypothetical protein NC652_026442 [Populus alba x Populus x berolinensis]|nr:hypothetical protein NC652_026442 [Populus alba x Populus x berolinensis]